MKKYPILSPSFEERKNKQFNQVEISEKVREKIKRDSKKKRRKWIIKDNKKRRRDNVNKAQNEVNTRMKQTREHRKQRKKETKKEKKYERFGRLI